MLKIYIYIYLLTKYAKICFFIGPLFHLKNKLFQDKLKILGPLFSLLLSVGLSLYVSNSDIGTSKTTQLTPEERAY